jgi:ribonuclease HI
VRVVEVANFAMVLWRAWTIRNKVTRAGEVLSIVSSMEYLMNLDKSLKEAGGKELTSGAVDQAQGNNEARKQEKIDSCWHPPDHATIKVKTDVAFNQTTGVAAIGIIARDHEGQPQFMAWRVIGRCRDVEEAEALALLEGMQMAELWPDSTHVEFETDCADLVRKVEGKGRDCSMISALILDIQEIMAKRVSCKVRKIWREQNMIVHNLAQFPSKPRTSQVVSFSFVPLCIQDLVLNDRSAVGTRLVLFNKGGILPHKKKYGEKPNSHYLLCGARMSHGPSQCFDKSPRGVHHASFAHGLALVDSFSCTHLYLGLKGVAVRWASFYRAKSTNACAW